MAVMIKPIATKGRPPINEVLLSHDSILKSVKTFPRMNGTLIVAIISIDDSFVSLNPKSLKIIPP